MSARTRRILPGAFLFVPLLWASGHAPCCGAPQWHVVPIASAGDLHVQLEILDKPSLADARWIRLAFLNKGSTPIPLERATYAIEATRYDAKTNKDMGGGQMARGNRFDLFPHTRKPSRPDGAIVAPGVYRQAREPSRALGAALGLPPRQGYVVRARAHVHVVTKSGHQIRTPGKGMPFAFTWSYPPAEGFRAMRARLRRLLENPENGIPSHSYILSALLGVEEVRRSVSLMQIGRALTLRKGGMDGRVLLAEHLHKAGYPRKDLVAWFRFRMHAGDKLVLEDLKHAPQSFWDESFLQPLVWMHEQHGGIEAVAFLWRHHEHWRTDRDASKRLFTATMKVHGGVLRMSGCALLAAKREDAFMRAVDELALGRSDEALRVLSAHLDDKTMLVPAGRVLLGRISHEPPLAHRTCDVALEGMLVVLHGRAWAGYRAVLGEKAAETVRDSRRGDTPQMLAIRDEAIRLLKAQLRDP